MSKLLLSFITVVFIFLGSANAEGNYKCNMNCDNKKMEKSHCKIEKKANNCDCKNTGNCTCKQNCKCAVSKKDEKAEKCGCGMSVKACNEMMPYCKFRDGEKSK